MKLRVINGDRDRLEDKILDDLLAGKVCHEDFERLRSLGDLKLVYSAPEPKVEHYPEFSISSL